MLARTLLGGDGCLRRPGGRCEVCGRGGVPGGHRRWLVFVAGGGGGSGRRGGLRRWAVRGRLSGSVVGFGCAGRVFVGWVGDRI